MKVVTLSEYV